MNEEKEKERGEIIKKLRRKSVHKLQKFCITFDTKLIAEALHVSEGDVTKSLLDGRNISWVCEKIALRIYNMKKFGSSNAKHDACISIDSELTNQVVIGIRSLTNGGVSLIPQSLTFGYPWKIDSTLVYLENSDYQVIFDVCDFPKVYVIPIRSLELVKQLYEGKFTQKFTREDFYKVQFGKSLEELEKDGGFKGITEGMFLREVVPDEE